MTSKEIIDIIHDEVKGFHIGNRLILPFRCQIIKLIVHNHIFYEFVGNKDVKLSQENKNTSVYFREAGRLSYFEDTYQYIKLVIAGFDEDLTKIENHIKIICHIEKDHIVDIKLAEDQKDIIFIE